MTYLVLARKWRPTDFKDVVGQEVIIRTLERALNSGRVAHAFLLTGSRGVGKTTVARLLAKALSCEAGVSSTPCQKCSHCREIATGESLDVIEIDGASNTGVDDVRELRENLRYQPSSARYKIFIIDEVHMLSTSAFNALLKTLEEPPPHVKFIFATTESHKIPVTILSRCQRYDFRRLSIKEIVSRLKFILKEEQLEVDSEALYLIAENADGGMRDALSLLDQVISFSGEKASKEDVIDILGLVDQGLIKNLTQALLEQKPEAVLKFLNQADASGYDLKQVIHNLIAELRNLCVASVAGTISGLADLSADRVQSIDKLAKQYEFFDLQRLFSMALKTADEMALSAHSKMVLELGLMKMAKRPQLAELSEVQKAIQSLGRLDSGLRQNDKKTSVPIKAQSSWKQFVNLICESMPALGHHLEHARYNDHGLMEFDQKLHFSRVEQACREANFKQLFVKHLGFEPRAVLSESIHAARETVAKKAQESIEEQARAHPVIQKAIEIFGGEIKAVRRKS